MRVDMNRPCIDLYVVYSTVCTIYVPLHIPVVLFIVVLVGLQSVIL